MLIRHKNPNTAGAVVIAARAYRFVDGVAEANLNGAEQAAILARGHTIEQTLVVDKPEPKPKRKREQAAEPADISDPAVEVTEEAPPEIG